MITHGARLLVLLAMLGLGATPAMAQPEVSTSDIERLQTMVNEAGREVASLRERDTAAARRLQAELDELQDEVIYLRVKLRKERSVPRAEYAELRDRLDRLRVRTGGDPPPAPAAAAAEDDREIPVGTELDVRLQTAISSGTAMVEDRFEATTLVDLLRQGQVVIPAGATVRGVITAVQAAGRVERKASLSLSFDRLTVRGRTYPLRATVTGAIEGEGIRGEAGRVGTGAAVGGVIGGILGGFRGMLAGILIGGGGTLVATEGHDVELKPGTVLRMRFDSPLVVAQ
ncbi:MAG: hypothetical protein Q8L86_00120 [Vicinamibacterales bacterium]|nr:hypothetical protein [Vicinamibacterales bacterium]